MATRAILHPYGMEPPTSSFPQLAHVNLRPVLKYSTGQEAFWTIIAPAGLTGAISIVLSYIMATATANNTKWEVRVEAVSDGDAVDLDAATSFDTLNATGDVVVPGTAGHLDQITLTLTNADSMTAADYVRIGIKRVAPTGTDATGTADFLSAELRDAA